MTGNEIRRIMAHKKPGRYVRVGFQSFPTLRSAFVGEYEVRKVSETTFKCKCDYKKTKKYIRQEAERIEPKKVIKPWAEWTEKNLYKRKISEPEKEYIAFVPVDKTANTRTKWYLKNLSTGKTTEVTKEQLLQMDIVRPSEFAFNDSPTVTISFDNILWIKE